MILYRGEILDNSRQEEVLRRLEEDLYTPTLFGDALPVETVISACDKLAKRVMDGAFAAVVEQFLSLFQIRTEQFEGMVRLFTRQGLKYKCAIELCDGETVIDGKVLRKRYPLGVLLHIAAGNVDVLPAYSVIEGLLSGNINLLKLPMGDSGLSIMLLHELIRIEPALTDYIYVFDVPSTQTATLKKLAKLSNGIVVWGGDAAVRAAMDMADVDTKVIAWGHKLSFAYAEPDATDAQLAELARSICNTNQLLCSSCQGIFVDTDSRETQMAFARRFFEQLKQANRACVPVEYGMRAKNAIHIYNERLEQHRTGNEILYGDGVSVIVSQDDGLELSYLYRNVWVKRLPLDRLCTLRRFKNHLQTAAVLTADREKQYTVCQILASTGVTRITSAGNMSRMVCAEAHDGTYALREYSRIVETELFE